jgi:hypothetical protein
MAEEIQSVNIAITGIEDTGTQIKIRDQNKRTYSFFKTKKDGGDTEAFKSFQDFKPGNTALIAFKEVPYKEGTIRNILMFRPATGIPETSQERGVSSAANWKKEKLPREYWEKREARKESNIFLQVAFKAAVELESASIRSGKEFNRNNLYNNTIDFYDWIVSQVGDGTEQKQTSTAGQSSANDQLGF